MIIGIAGGSGSGKTTLLNRLLETYKTHKPAALRQDNYYFPKEKQKIDENGWINFDLPSALDQETFASDLKSLLSGKEVVREEYQYNVSGLKRKTLRIEPSGLIFVEGLYVFYSDEVRDQLEVRILLETEKRLQFDRRLSRDQQQRDLKEFEVVYQWENHVLPCYKTYLEPFEKFADFRFSNNHDFEEEFQRLKQYIDERLY